jgi:DNA topoisomerase-1
MIMAPSVSCFDHQFRVCPEDITLNIGEGATIPVPDMPGDWKAIQHDQTVTWLATWTENVNGNHKYVFLAAGSSLKGQSDMLKFEKARELKASHIIRYVIGTHTSSPYRITLIASDKTTTSS